MEKLLNKRIIWILLGIGLVCCFVLGYRYFAPAPPDPAAQGDAAAEEEPLPALEDPPPEEEVPEDDGLPHDKLFITVERQNYQDGDLTLIIPKLDRELPIYGGVTKEDLKKGVGLYDYAQLPGEGNRNVSVAGHRNTIRNGKISDAAPFYYIDTLAEDDYLYLRDKERIYRYVYEDTKVVEADDWGPIYSQGFSCLTITSCEPIGISDHRIVVRGRLDEIFPLSDDFVYLTSRQAEEEAQALPQGQQGEEG